MSGYSGEKAFAVVAETRRRWSSLAEKLALVAETGSRPVSAVARKHGLAPSLLFRWRRELKGKETGAARESGFAPVALAMVPALRPASASMPSPSTEGH